MVDKLEIYTFPKNDYALQEGPAYDERTYWDGTFLNYCPGCGGGWDCCSNSYECGREENCPELQLQEQHYTQAQGLINYLVEGELGDDWLEDLSSVKNEYRGQTTTAAAWADWTSMNITIPWWTLRNKRHIFRVIPHEVAHITIVFKLDAVLEMLKIPEPPRSLEELKRAEDGNLASISQYYKYIEGEQEKIRGWEKEIRSGVSKGVVGPGGKPSKLTFSDKNYIYLLIGKAQDRIKSLEKGVEALEEGLKKIREEIINHPETSTVAEVQAGWLQSVKDYETYSSLKEIRDEEWAGGGNFDKRGQGHWTEWRDEGEYMFEKAMNSPFASLNYYGDTASNVEAGTGGYSKADYAFKSEQFKSALQQLRERRKGK